MSTQEEPKKWKYLDRRPGSRYRQLYVKGTKFSACQIFVESLPRDGEPGQTPEELADDFGIPVEAVREAIAYCESDPPEIRRDGEIEQAILEIRGMTDRSYLTNPKVLTAEDLDRIHRLRSEP